MVTILPKKALYLLLAPVLFSALLCSGNPAKRSVNEEIQQLILKGASVFSTAKDLEGFEIFQQELVGQNTIYTSADKPSFKLSHGGNDISSGANVIIIDPSEDNIHRKDKTVYLVLRKRISDPKTFTAHLVYIRKFKGETSLEWDYYLFDESREKWSFAFAFSPEKFLSKIFGEANSGRAVRDIMAAPGLPTKKVKKESSSEEEAKKKKKKKKKEESDEDEEEDKDEKKKKKKKKKDDEDDEELPPECKEDKKPKRRKRKQPKVVYKININHIICASGGDCKPDPCLGKGKKSDDKSKARSLVSVNHPKEILFEGFGICSKIEPPATTLEKPHLWTGENEIIAFILQTLRVQCIPQAITQVKDILMKRIVTSDEKFHLELNSDHPLFQLKAPGMGEWSDIAGALYFKVYSNTYFEEAGKMAEHERHALSPNKKPISSSAQIITIITQKIFRYFKGVFEPHIYKMIKILEVMLETKYAHILQHKETDPKPTDLNDLIQLQCLYKLLNLDTIDEILSKDLKVLTSFEELYHNSLATFTAAAEKSSALQH